MKKESIKIRIIDMEYDEEEKIFVMKVFNINKQEEVQLVIREKDFGIPENTPIDVINNFLNIHFMFLL